MGWLRTVAEAAAAMAGMAVTVYVLHLRSRSPATVRPGVSESVMRLLHHGRQKLLTNLLDVGGFFGIDIGGSLTKLVFFLPDKELVERMLRRVPEEHVVAGHWKDKIQAIHDVAGFTLSTTTYGGTGTRDAHLSFHISELGGTFHFIRFETRRMKGAVRLAQQHRLSQGMSRICATGGGAHKFSGMARDMLGVELDSRDEINCLVKGLAFLMGYVHAEAYTFDGRVPSYRIMTEGVQYPYLLVNIGSGVGFILVHSEDQWQRVSGTSLGGGTYYGLCHMLTGVSSFDDMLDMAEDGDNVHVDLTVGDIYGGDYTKFGLKATTIASSFGKAVTWSIPPPPPPPPITVLDGRAGAGGEVSSHTTRPMGHPLSATMQAAIANDAGGFRPDIIGGRGPTRSATAQPPTPIVAHVGEEPLITRSRGASATVDTPDASRSPTTGMLLTSHGMVPGIVDTGGMATPVPEYRMPYHAPAPAAMPMLDDSKRVVPPSDVAREAATRLPAEAFLAPSVSPATAAGTPAMLLSSSRPPAAASPMATPHATTANVAAGSSTSAGVSSSPASAPGVGGGDRERAGSMPGLAGGGSGDGSHVEAKDISRSLLIMISNNIGQLAFLNAVRYRCKHVYFAGNFLRHENTIAMRTLAYAINFWSQGSMEGLFLRHEGYCGALGAFLSTLEVAEEGAP